MIAISVFVACMLFVGVVLVIVTFGLMRSVNSVA